MNIFANGFTHVTAAHIEMENIPQNALVLLPRVLCLSAETAGERSKGPEASLLQDSCAVHCKEPLKTVPQ